MYCDAQIFIFQKRFGFQAFYKEFSLGKFQVFIWTLVYLEKTNRPNYLGSAMVGTPLDFFFKYCAEFVYKVGTIPPPLCTVGCFTK